MAGRCSKSAKYSDSIQQISQLGFRFVSNTLATRQQHLPARDVLARLQVRQQHVSNTFGFILCLVILCLVIMPERPLGSLATRQQHLPAREAFRFVSNRALQVRQQHVSNTFGFTPGKYTMWCCYCVANVLQYTILFKSAMYCDSIQQIYAGLCP